MKYIGRLLIGSFVVLWGTTMTSCNSNDDFGAQAIEIPGVTIDGDIDCCSAEEALQVYNFLQTVKIIPELSTVVDGQYNVFAYSKTGTFHTGYNEIFFVATKKKNGNYVKNYDITDVAPQMLMVKMNMKHSTPVGGSAESFDENRLAVKRTWVSFVMNTSEAGSWTLSYHASVLGSTGGIEAADITVAGLPEGQQWLKSFKAGGDTYYLSLVNPTDWTTGTNAIRTYVSKKSTEATVPYALASGPSHFTAHPLEPRPNMLRGLLRKLFEPLPARDLQPFDLEGFLQDHRIPYEARSRQGGIQYIVQCPWQELHSSHSHADSAIFRYPDGRIGYKCLHAHCAGRTWHDFRAFYDPDAYAWMAQ